jgi:hypothetical protein
VYAGQNTAIQTLAAKVLQFDLALEDYGPEASAARTQLREGLAKSIDQVCGLVKATQTSPPQSSPPPFKASGTGKPY